MEGPGQFGGITDEDRRNIDGSEAVLGTEATEQGRHTAGPEGTASYSTGELEQALITFGGFGSEPGQFRFPRGVVVSPSNEIFVGDRGNRRVQVYSTWGVYLRHFPTVVPGSGGEKKMMPDDVCMDGNFTLWVVGNGGSDHHVVQYSTDGTALLQFDLPVNTFVHGMAVDMRTNHILVTDGDRGEVQVFRPDGSLVRRIRLPRGKISCACYITVDDEGNILVSDRDTHSVYVYNDFGMRTLGGEGSGEGQLKDPRGICTDRAGNIIVADSQKERVKIGNTGYITDVGAWNRRVQIFTCHGEFVRTVNCFSSTASDIDCLAVGLEGHLVVINRWDHTVTVITNY
ncbi:tripartite motif-containing protein 3-like [Branchiostoma lanceolatum]|uniref:tripartite motif-containing protein 3-like n=1 Tax=Branchiostoma lanceolatum TaxID=7740 RepID=UPI003456DA63